MNQTSKHPATWRERGQSLVEVALFLPVFIVILAGLIEVSQLVITQNRVSQAARVSSRFGANGGQNDGMAIVALNSVTQTLQMGDDQWDMWVVRGEIDSTGTAFVPGTWEFEHVYGISNTVSYTDIDETTIQNEIFGDLQANNLPSNNIKVVGLYALHDVESILGLDALPFLNDVYTIQGFSIMRQLGDVVEQTNGCAAFPIAVHHGVRSVNPPGAGSNPYPNPGDFDNNNPPAYDDFVNNPPPHRPDIPLLDAKAGDVYYVQQGFGSGNFGWLRWNNGINVSANTLAGSLSWPGDSLDYADHGDGGQPATPLYPHVVRGYVNPDDTSDLALNIGDWVAANTGSINSNAVRTILREHITKASEGRELRLIVWDTARNPGSNGEYQIYGFAIFKLHGYHLSQSQGGSWILAEFMRWDTSCGQVAPAGP